MPYGSKDPIDRHRSEHPAVVDRRSSVVREDEKLIFPYLPLAFGKRGAPAPAVDFGYPVDQNDAEIDSDCFARQTDHSLHQPEVILVRMGDYEDLAAGKRSS